MKDVIRLTKKPDTPRPDTPRKRRSQTRLGSATVPTSKVMETSVPKAMLATRSPFRPRRIKRSRIAGVLACLLFLWIIYLLFELPDFYIYSAHIQGNRVLNPQEIYDASGVHSQSIFWVNPAQITRNIEQLPNIKRAEVYLTLPANLVIKVEERLPEVLWQTGEQVWWIDNEGLFVPPRTEAGLNDGRLRIIDQDHATAQPRKQIDVALVHSAQMVHNQHPEIKTLYYSQHHGLSYLTAEGWPIYLGASQNIAAKLLVGQAVQADLLARGVTPNFIDVRNPLRAIYEEKDADTGF